MKVSEETTNTNVLKGGIYVKSKTCFYVVLDIFDDIATLLVISDEESERSNLITYPASDVGFVQNAHHSAAMVQVSQLEREILNGEIIPLNIHNAADGCGQCVGVMHRQFARVYARTSLASMYLAGQVLHGKHIEVQIQEMYIKQCVAVVATERRVYGWRLVLGMGPAKIKQRTTVERLMATTKLFP